MRTLPVLLVVTLLLALSGRAEAKHIRYAGAHPIAARHGGGYCYIEVPHIHAYLPDHQTLYQQVGDEYVFTGDPTPFGYDGERHTFYGHHPVVGIEVGAPVYCVLDGPHFHAFAPPPIPDFKVKGDVAFYIGPPLPVRPARVKLVNAEVRPWVTFRPVVTVEPPPEFHAEIDLPGPPGVMFVAPGPPSVMVSAPRPRVDVEVSAPGVFFAPPAPPSFTVVAPAPPRVVVGAPGVVVEGRGRWEPEHGRHKGWNRRGDE